MREDFEDVMELIEYHWNWHIKSLRLVAPNAKFVFIWGNHERRIIQFLLKNAPQFRKTLLRQFANIIRAQGVWWLGEVDSVRLGPLKVEHGVNYGKNAAKASAERGAYQISKWQGHGHNLQFFAINGEDYAIASIQSGHLSRYDPNTRTPHYTRAQSNKGQYHQIGTGVADVNLAERYVQFTNLEFVEDGHGQLKTRFERQTLHSGGNHLDKSGRKDNLDAPDIGRS